MAGSKVIGMDRAIKDMGRVGEAARRAFAGAMYLEGLHIMADSVPRVPVISSRLRNSHFVTLPSETNLTLRLGYGTKYAWRVHEGIVRRVKDMKGSQQMAFWARARVFTSGRSGGSVAEWKTSEVGGPKYLVNAMDATKGGRSGRMQRSTGRLFARGKGVTPSPTMPTKPNAPVA